MNDQTQKHLSISFVHIVMGFANLCLRRSASRLASSVGGGRVRSISTVVNRPSLVHNPSLLRPFYSTQADSTVATDDDLITSEQDVLWAIKSEFNGPPHNEKDLWERFAMAIWTDRSISFKEPPASFPFQIEDIPGNRTVTMTREYNGEHIKVVVSKNKESEDDAPSNESRDDAPSNESRDDAPSNESRDDAPSNESRDDAPSNESRDDAPSNESRDDAPSNESRDDAPSNESNDDEDDEPSPFDCPLVVTLTKKSGRSLELRCRISSEEIIIDDIYVSLQVDSSEDPKVIRNINDCVGFEHDELKETLIKYLKVRGLDVPTIHMYMGGKMKEEYWLWLDCVKEYFEE